MEKNIIVGLDIGTTKVCTIVGIQRPDSELEIIGIGTHPSHGLKKGSVVNIGSFSWMLGQGGMPGYTTAKSAIMGLTRTLARDLGIYNIRVNCVVPGWIITERQRKLWLTPEIEKQQLERQCIKRMLEPNDIAKPVLFFASDQSSGCSAQNYVVDGGIVH